MMLCLSVWAGVVDSCKSTRAIYCEARGEERQSPEGETEGRKEGVSFGPHTARRTQEQREEVMAL